MELLICEGEACLRAGANRLVALARELEAAGAPLRLGRIACASLCKGAPCVVLDGCSHARMQGSKLRSLVAGKSP